MIVAELINKLRAMPQDMRVVVNGYEGDFDDPNVYEEWVTIDCNEGRDDVGWWMGKHEDVGGYDEKRRREMGAELVIVISRLTE
jgi:hypothetical protein